MQKDPTYDELVKKLHELEELNARYLKNEKNSSLFLIMREFQFV